MFGVYLGIFFCGDILVVFLLVCSVFCLYFVLVIFICIFILAFCDYVVFTYVRLWAFLECILSGVCDFGVVLVFFVSSFGYMCFGS